MSVGTEPHRSEGVATTGVALKTDSRQPAGCKAASRMLAKGTEEGSRLDKSLDGVNP